MQRIGWIVILIIGLHIQAFAQSKTLTLEEAVLQQYSMLAPANMSRLQWIPGTEDYSYIDKTDDNHRLMRGKINGADEVICDLASINFKLEGTKSTDPIKAFPRFQWEGPNSFVFLGKNSVIRFDINEGKGKVISSAKMTAPGTDLAPDPTMMAFTAGEKLMLMKDSRMKEIGENAGDGIVYGSAVHRYEFGISKGTFWSPNSEKLAFYRKDESMVTDYPLVSINEKPAALNDIKYPMAGMPSHHVQIGIYDVASEKIVYLKTGDPKEQYLTNIAWGPEGKYIYVAVVNRNQNHMWFKQFNAKNGAEVKTLFEEKHPKYVEPLHPMHFVPGKDDQFLWFSERDGFTHLYLYNLKGKMLKQVTSGNWSVKSIIGFDEKRKTVVVNGTGANATETHIYKASLSSGKVTQLTTAKGSHSGSMSEEGGYIIDQFSSITVPRKITIIDLKGKEVKPLLKADNPLKEYALRKAELLTVEGADGTQLHARMIKPADFDASKKYPVLIYVYGGPHAQMVRNTWGAAAPMWMYEFANRGYLVFTVDNRGSDNRGRDFEQAVFRKLGQEEMKDQMKGVEYLKSLNYVDPNRIAVHGWSFGGFMTTSLLLNHPGTFKAGVAGGPVIDWKYYEIMYTERYMDTPESNPKGYEQASLLNKAGQLEDKLLMIHGTVDDVVVWQHSLDFVKKCVDEGKQLDYFVYPGHPHNVRGKDRLHLMTKVLNYIEDNL